MKLLAELTEKEIFGAIRNTDLGPVDFRRAVRAVLFNSDKKVGMNFAEKRNIYKLPGGGMDENEDFEQALMREVKEETGCKIKIDKELGAIIEYRHYENKSLLQVSYSYIANVVEQGERELTEHEVEQGFQLGWFDINELIALMEKVEPLDDDNGAFFIAKRELIFIKEAKKVLGL